MSLLSCIRTIVHDNKTFYRVNDITSTLKVRHVATALLQIQESEKLYHSVPTIGGNQKVFFITLNGFKRILISSRKPAAVQLAKEIGIDIMDYKVLSAETCTISCLLKAFQNDESIQQYYVNGLKIDLYFPKYKLAIECDESFHAVNKEHDDEREKVISSALGCSFIRYRPHERGFCIFNVINDIHDEMIRYITQL
jgi:very-short-patch-repair endonuclease